MRSSKLKQPLCGTDRVIMDDIFEPLGNIDRTGSPIEGPTTPGHRLESLRLPPLRMLLSTVAGPSAKQDILLAKPGAMAKISSSERPHERSHRLPTPLLGVQSLS
jgi:hypothetical protein